MRFLTVKLLTATALSLSLAACVPGAPLPGATAAVVAPPTPEPGKNAVLYAAKNDGSFVVPAVPVEQVPESFQRQDVAYTTTEAVGTVIISPGEKHLYLVTGKNKATRYGIAVGKEGFQWAGEALITGRQNWPKWTPPPEMIERKPELSKWEKGQPGGPTNPLGARALYLTTNGVDYGYRIHGTPEWNSIGKNASSGCIRMINQDVMDLYTRVQDGAKVVVLNTDGSYPSALKLPPKPPAKKKAAPATAAAAPALIVPKPAVMPAPIITGVTPAVAPAVVAPVVAPATVAPVVAPLPEPAADTPPPVCAVPLVNGLCPA
jgi:lipoprotein-anchoring transpeptidase ErfK/SrfK